MRRELNNGPSRPPGGARSVERRAPLAGRPTRRGIQMLYLSQVIGRPVRDMNGEPIGKVADLIVAVGERYPPVTGVVIKHRSAPDLPALVVGRSRSTSMARACKHFDARHQQVPPAARTRSCSRRDLMDKQIVDIDGRRVVRVNDVSLDDREWLAAPRRRRRWRRGHHAQARHRGPVSGRSRAT